MIAISSPSLENPTRAGVHGGDSLRTNSVDLVASLLTSLIVFTSLGVGLLGIVYFTCVLDATIEPIDVEPSRPAGGGVTLIGFENDLEPPGEQSVEDLTEPSLEQSILAMTDALSSIDASIESLDASLASSSGASRGDWRKAGPTGDGAGGIPRYERWELKFSARSYQQHARQLDFHRIELAAVGGTEFVDYAPNFASKPAHRSGESSDEKRLSFTLREEGSLKQYETQLLNASGVLTDGRILLKFIDVELEDRLARIEMQFAVAAKGSDISVDSITKTIFESVPSESGGYQWRVVDQRYRLRD